MVWNTLLLNFILMFNVFQHLYHVRMSFWRYVFPGIAFLGLTYPFFGARKGGVPMKCLKFFTKPIIFKILGPPWYLLSNLISDFWCIAQEERQIHSFSSCSFPTCFVHSKLHYKALNNTFQTLLSNLILDFWCSAQEERQIHSFSSCSFPTHFLHSKFLCKALNYTF